MKYSFILAICALGFVTKTSAQFTYQYTKSHGLLSNQVYAFDFDKNGLMWFATDKGLGNFNGYDVKSLETENDDIIYLAIDENQRIWCINSSAQLSFIDSGNLKTHYNTAWLPKKLNGINNNHISFSNAFYIIHGRSISKIENDSFINIADTTGYDKGNLKPWTQNNQLYFLGRHHNYTIVNDTLVRAKRDISFQLSPLLTLSVGDSTFVKYQDKIRLITPDSIFTIYEDKHQNLFHSNIYFDRDRLLISARDGLYELIAHELSLYRKTSSPISCYRTDAFGNQWFSTLGDGVFQIPHSFSDFTLVKSNESNDNPKKSIFRTDKGILASHKNGQISINDQLFFLDRRFRLNCKSADYIQNQYIIGTDVGIYVVSPNQLPKLIVNIAVKKSTIYKDRLYVASNRGLSSHLVGDILNKSRNHILHFNSRLYSFCIKENDDILFSSIKGFYLYQKGEFELINPNYSSIQTNCKYMMNMDEQRTLLVTGEDLVYVLKADYTPIPTISVNLKTLGEIEKVCQDPSSKDMFWIASNTGISKWIFRNDSFVQLQHVLMKNSEGASSIVDIEVDSNNVHFLNDQGLFSFDKTIDLERNVSQCKLLDVKSLNESLGLRQKYVLSPNKNNITFSIFDPTFSTYSFYYRIKQKEDSSTWVKMDQHELSIPLLKHGDYLFQFKSIGFNQQSSNVLEVPVIVQQRLTDSPWFVTSIFLLISAMLIYIYMYRRNANSERKMLQDNLRLKESSLNLKGLQSQMNPHFMRNSLNSIQSLVYTGEKRIALKYISRFSKLIEQFIHQSRDNFITVEDEIAMLEDFISLEKLRFSNRFRANIEVLTDGLNHLEIPSLLIQPLVENAIEHGLSGKSETQKQVIIRFEKIDKNLVISVIDNGKGIKLNQQRKASVALDNLQERIATINQMKTIQLNFNIFNHQNKQGQFKTGTTATITIDYKEND